MDRFSGFCRRAAACVLAGSLLFAGLTGCAVSKNSDDIFEPVPATEKPTEKPTAEPTETPTAPPEETAEPTPTPTETPTAPPSVDPTALFQKSVFIGNSCVDSLMLSGVIDGATFLGRTALTVSQVFTKSTNTGSVPIMDELNGKEYDKVFLLFGENELGWQSTEIFVSKYAEVIDGVRERVPGAQVYLLSIMPVTAAAHARNQYMVNNDRICEFNALIRQLAEDKSAIYIDLFEAMSMVRGFSPIT